LSDVDVAKLLEVVLRVVAGTLSSTSTRVPLDDEDEEEDEEADATFR
jgi:hypothetical protein